MKRKIVALLLVFTLVFSLSATASPFVDIADKPCRNAVELLYTLGIVDGRTSTEFMSEDSLSRAELVLILLRTMGIGQLDGGNVVFDDVTEDHWAFNEIGYAHSLKMINGISDRIFAPDAPVTCNQAVKMVVSLLGYDFMASSKGGYPSGYLYAANQLELLKGVGVYGEEPITRGEMAMLVANALKTEVAATSSVGKNDGQLETHMEKGKYLMSQYLDIQMLEGRVNAHYYGSVSGNMPENTDEVIIGDTLLRIGDTDVFSMLGENVIAYVKDKEDGLPLEIVYVERATGTDVVTFTANDVLKVTNDKIVYTLDDKEYRLNLASVDLYVNGIEKLSLSGYDLTSASYKFIENSGRKLLIVDAYANAVVKSFNAGLGTLYLEENDPFVLENYDAFVLKNAEGEDIAVGDVKPWNVISYVVCERNGLRILYGFVNSATAEGKVVSVGSSGDYTELQMDETLYKVSNDLFGDIPELGKEVKFYTNYLGHIAAIDSNASDFNYGYLVEAGREDPFARMELKIFTHNGEMKYFAVRDKVQLNGTSVKQSELNGETALYPDGDVIKRQLIRYELSSTGEVKSIETASDSIVPSSNRETFGRNFYSQSTAEGRWVNTFASRYIVDKNTVYFKIPINEDAEDEDYEIINTSSFEVYDTYVSPAYFYDIDENNIIGAIYKEYDKGTAGATFEMTGKDIQYGVVIDKKHKIVDDEDYAVLTISRSNLATTVDVLINETEVPIRMTVTGSNAGNKMITNELDPYYGEEYISYDAVDIGDIMIFQVDKDSIAYDAQMMIRANYPKVFESLYDDNPGANYSVSGYYRWASSVAKHVSPLGVTGDVEIYNGSIYERMFLKANVLIYDSSTGEVLDGAWEDLQDGDRFSIAQWSIYPSLLLIYR